MARYKVTVDLPTRAKGSEIRISLGVFTNGETKEVELDPSVVNDSLFGVTFTPVGSSPPPELVLTTVEESGDSE